MVPAILCTCLFNVGSLWLCCGYVVAVVVSAVAVAAVVVVAAELLLLFVLFLFLLLLLFVVVLFQCGPKYETLLHMQNAPTVK